MKKNLFLMAAAALALASCSSDDVVELSNENAIGFRVTMGPGVDSRGQETTNGNIGQFKVTAYDGSSMYFRDLLFTPDAEDANTYVSSPVYRWPGSDELTFYGYSCFTGVNDSNKPNDITEAMVGKLSADGLTLTGFTPATDVASQIDFVTATATGKAENGQGAKVNMQFKHQLVQLQIKARAETDVYKFEVTGVEYANVKSTGDFAFKPAGSNNWTLADTKKAYEISLGTPITLTATVQDLSDNGNIGYAMLLPQELDKWVVATDKANADKGAYLAVKLRITTKETGMVVYPKAKEGVEATPDYDWARIPVTGTWEAGNRYVYTLDFSRGAGYDEKGDPILGGPIECTAEVSGWNEATPGTTLEMDTTK